MDDDRLADDFSNEGCLELAMLPPGENADALSDQDSDSCTVELVHHLPWRLLNSLVVALFLTEIVPHQQLKIPNSPPKKKVKPNTRKWKTKTKINSKINVSESEDSLPNNVKESCKKPPEMFNVMFCDGLVICITQQTNPSLARKRKFHAREEVLLLS